MGTATTVVYTDKLSEEGIRRGVKARHTYVKIVANKGPDVRLTAKVPGRHGERGIIGDVVRGREVDLRAQVLNGIDATQPDPLLLKVVKDGVAVHTETVTSNDHVYSFRASEHGRYRLQLERGPVIEVVSSPIWFEPQPKRCHWWQRRCHERGHDRDDD